MDPGIKLLGFVILGSLVAFGVRWVFKRVVGEPTPDPTQSPWATPFSGDLDDVSGHGIDGH